MAKPKLTTKAQPVSPDLAPQTLLLAAPPAQHPRTRAHPASQRCHSIASNAHDSHLGDPTIGGASPGPLSTSLPNTNSTLTAISVNHNLTVISPPAKMTLSEIDEAIPIMKATLEQAKHKRASMHGLRNMIKKLAERVEEDERATACDTAMDRKQISLNERIEAKDSGAQQRGLAVGMVTRRQSEAKLKAEKVSVEKEPKTKSKSIKGRRGSKKKEAGVDNPGQGVSKGVPEAEERRRLSGGSKALYREMNKELQSISENLAVLEKEVDSGVEKEKEYWAKRIVENLEMEEQV